MKSARTHVELAHASTALQGDHVSIAKVSCIEDAFLQSRLIAGRRPGTSEYLACSKGAEVGLLIFEEYPNHAFGLIYEVFVLEPYRRLGIGLQLLKHAEELARNKGFSSVRLQAKSLDRLNVSDQALMQWYGKNGYLAEECDAGWMRKSL